MINQLAFTGKTPVINSVKEFATEKAHEYLGAGTILQQAKSEAPSKIVYASPFESVGNVAKTVKNVLVSDENAANYALSHGVPKSAISVGEMKHIDFLA